MDDASVRWWTAQQQACTNCGGVGVPVLLDIQDADSKEAIYLGLASLGGCGLGGARFDRQCLSCGTGWAVS